MGHVSVMALASRLVELRELAEGEEEGRVLRPLSRLPYLQQPQLALGQICGGRYTKEVVSSSPYCLNLRCSTGEMRERRKAQNAGEASHAPGA
jgi:hypothetical protein